MAAKIQLEIDLAFSVTEPAMSDRTPSTVNGTVTASGSTVEVYLDTPEAFSGGTPLSLDAVRELAKALADKGVAVSVTGPKGNLVSLGAVDVSRVQRLLTRSPHIRLGSISALTPMAKSVRGSGKSTGSSGLLPPSTPFPLVPTVNRNIRRRVTTTHHTPGSGRARLIFVQDSATWNGQVPREFNLGPVTTTIGSGGDADLLLPGLDAIHAEVVHNEDDEYVLIPHGPVSGSVNSSGPSVLRTGARIQLGPWCLAYFREEYADHGRPFGGRSGGELAYQRPQFDPRTGRTEGDGSEGVGDFRRRTR
ncbi:FHA domain-containing protein [Arthrobacter sp. H20]|uniref:FHA domain-containing protein n=1 Tax=Arthrobacter sp. H20 TaxID=1267981 RepID=UPI00047B7423|nr:FHA domain-containing protein [Arthrobacter sp. H20]